jgi:hypothetical protein
MIHLQNLPHLHNDRDAIRFHRRAAHTEPLAHIGGSLRDEISPRGLATLARIPRVL